MDINLLMVKINCLMSWFILNCLFSHAYAQKLGFEYWLQLAMMHSQTLKIGSEAYKVKAKYMLQTH
jgi:hypothetical protein